MEGDPAAAVAVAQPVKRKRGRPRKSETTQPLVPTMQTTPTSAATDSTLKPKKQRKRKGDGVSGGVPPSSSSVDVSMIGQPVTGVLEGTFDAGYLLSVRVGSSDTVLRGVVFGPGLSVPLSKGNDVAPGVKQVRREAKPLPAKPSPPAPATATAPSPAPATAIAPALAGAAPAMKPVHHVLPSPLSFMVHSNLPAPPTSAMIPPTSAVLESAAALFGNSIQTSVAPPPPPPNTGLVAALQQLPGGGYTPPDPVTFSQAPSFQPESVKSL